MEFDKASDQVPDPDVIKETAARPSTTSTITSSRTRPYTVFGAAKSRKRKKRPFLRCSTSTLVPSQSLQAVPSPESRSSTAVNARYTARLATLVTSLAIPLRLIAKPLYTRPNPPSPRTISGLNPRVTARSSASVNSLSLGTSRMHPVFGALAGHGLPQSRSLASRRRFVSAASPPAMGCILALTRRFHGGVGEAKAISYVGRDWRVD
ncbi:hypothetical protein PR202_gb14915 [Eleusine coracana subsp. coracana]|uniref:Uncharacterized protein n=1 Tax=Eleusine coracana subsp. coracana TaxID=191504 RepID=A0AAV5EWI2_ELECO|nr:hypothetical protein PR202_gb14915 [Eleusine coracana subsp. coracana]